MIKDPRDAGPRILSFHSQFITMARVKLGPIVTDISGSIGGMTIQRNKFGTTIRQKPIPLKSLTPAQTTIRAHISIIQTAWSNLTDAQRLQWDRFLDFSGQSIKADRSVKLSGHSLYLKYQFFRLLTGFPLLTTITYIPMPTTRGFSEVDWINPYLKVHFDGLVNHLSYFFIFSMSSTKSPNRAFSKQGLRYMSTIQGVLNQYQIQDPYISAFGIVPSVGSTFHYSLRWFSTLAPVFSGVITGTATVQS